jgi:hypothetical protein
MLSLAEKRSRLSIVEFPADALKIEKEKKELEEKGKSRYLNESALEKDEDVTDLKFRYYEQHFAV